MSAAAQATTKALRLLALDQSGATPRVLPVWRADVRPTFHKLARAVVHAALEPPEPGAPAARLSTKSLWARVASIPARAPPVLVPEPYAPHTRRAKPDAIPVPGPPMPDAPVRGYNHLKSVVLPEMLRAGAIKRVCRSRALTAQEIELRLAALPKARRRIVQAELAERKVTEWLWELPSPDAAASRAADARRARRQADKVAAARAERAAFMQRQNELSPAKRARRAREYESAHPTEKQIRIARRRRARKMEAPWFKAREVERKAAEKTKAAEAAEWEAALAKARAELDAEEKKAKTTA